MKVEELSKLAAYESIKLKSARDGKVVCSSKKGLERFYDVEVMNIFTEFEIGKIKNVCRTVICAYISQYDIDKIRIGE